MPVPSSHAAVFDRLLRDRIVTLFTPIDDAVAAGPPGGAPASSLLQKLRAFFRRRA